ncbi:MAG: SPOR domain-containing protein, partial [Gracilimonas sp.]
NYYEELRTFSDGSYYAYEIPPGNYELMVDPGNLETLKSKSIPDTLKFEVKALPEGDFIEGLNLLLVPQDYEEPKPEEVSANIGVTQTAYNGGGISIDYNIEVDKLHLNECRYGIQLGAFSTMEAAKSIVKNYSRESESYIVYNEPRKLYAVRTGLYQNLGKASEVTVRTSKNYPDAAVLNQCYGSVASNYDPGDVRFDLQFGAFSNSNRAEAFIDQLKKDYKLSPYSYHDPKSYLYKVRIGPYKTLQSAETKRKELLSSTSLTDIYISKQEVPASMINVDFEFVLQLGEFETTRKAALYAIRIEEEFDLKSKILIDEREAILLVVEQVFTDWKYVLDLKDKISRNNAFQPPVVHLLEQKMNGQLSYRW